MTMCIFTLRNHMQAAKEKKARLEDAYATWQAIQYDASKPTDTRLSAQGMAYYCANQLYCHQSTINELQLAISQYEAGNY